MLLLAGYALFYSLSLWLRLTSLIFRFMFVQDSNNNNVSNRKSVKFSLCTFHTHKSLFTQRAHRLWRFVCSLYCSFPLSTRPPATYFWFHFVLHFYFVAAVCCCCFCCMYVRALQTRLHFHFSYFRPVFFSFFALHTYKRILLLCRFYNLSLYVRTPCLICSLRCCQISYTLAHTHTHIASALNFLSCSLKVSFVYILRTCAE